MSDYIDDTNLKVAIDELGDLWFSFEECLVPETAIIFNKSYNLIVMSVKDCALSLDISTLLVDESQDIPSVVNNIRETFLVYLVDILTNMGIMIDKEHVDPDSLPYLNTILETIYTTDGMEDVMGLIYVLENETFTNKERVIEVIKRVHDLDDDEVYPDLIRDISADVVKGLMMGLGADTDATDDREVANEEVTKRVKANREFLKGTLAATHVINNGAMGLSYQVLSDMFINDLAKLIVGEKRDYYKNILAMLLISSMTNEEIESGYEGMIKDFANDLEELYVGSVLLEELVLE